MNQISVQTLHDHLPHIDPAKELIIDVRTPAEYIAGHLPGAVNRPLDEIDRHVDEFQNYETVYVHCKSGGRSSQACQKLEDLHLDGLVNVEGGALAWAAAGYELEK